MAVTTSLGAQAGRALSWSFASTVLNRLSTIGIGVALARILGPDDFGTFAVAMVALLALLSFNELGVSLAIVRWPGDPRDIAPTVVTISVLSSVLVFGACFLAAPAFAAAMSAPAATPVVRVLTIGVLISGLVATPVGMLQRHFRQDRKAIADQVSTWAGALTSIGCALAGLGAMSLAIGQLTGAVAGAILFIAFEPRSLRPGFDRGHARALLRFGLPLAGSSMIVFAASNVDRLIVGAVLGPVPLGIYVLAFNLSNWPNSIFALPVRAVAPALLARLQGDPPAMRTTFLSALELLAAITLPVCVLLAAASAPVVGLLYGDAWTAAGPVLVWLGLLGALRILFELCYDYFVVLADTRVVLVVQVVWLLALLPAVYLGVRGGGAAGAAAAQFVVAALVVAPVYLWELRRTGIGAGAVGARVLWPVAAAGAAALVSVVAVRAIPADLVALPLVGVAGVAAIALLVYRRRTALHDLRAMRVPS